MSDHDATSAPSPSRPGSDTDLAPDSVRPVDLRDYVQFHRDEAHRTRVYATARLAHDLWCVEPQQASPVLCYPDADVAYTVIAGRSWFVTDQGDVGLDPMGALLIPAGTVHGIDNRGADPLIVSATSAPCDPDEAEDAPVVHDGAAIRDDAKYGHRARQVRARVEQVLRR